ncbi:hypothetical protein [Falsiroseomonas sp.]|uniref:hypothetical protein n=1 Tax=Falsiroseomonas sp. TaxID=2870721 RepID=UPI0027348180|nr:hypothetical protein [Falsiroseomonas sp.]MDP3414920.1 hypothetical protein [Falsiroseomonas sp.]
MASPSASSQGRVATGDQAPRPLPRLLAIGLLALAAIGLAAPLLVLVLPFPVAVAFGGLGAFLAGVVMAMRLRSGAFVALGLVGLFGFIGVAAEAALWFRLGGAVDARLESVAAAPSFPDASRLAFPEAIARGDLAGEARSSIPRSAGPPVELSAFAVPLVPPGWDRSQPVAAFLVCAQPRDEAPCATAFPPRLTEAFRTTARPEAARAALALHGLTAVPNPAFLATPGEIASDRARAGWMGLAWPLLAWLAWAAGLAVYRMISVPRRRPARA